MGAGCLMIPCSIETVCGVGASTVAIAAKMYEINKLRKKRSVSLPNNKVLLPPIRRKKRNYTE
jgi:hypothetical protein